MKNIENELVSILNKYNINTWKKNSSSNKLAVMYKESSVVSSNISLNDRCITLRGNIKTDLLYFLDRIKYFIFKNKSYTNNDITLYMLLDVMINKLKEENKIKVIENVESLGFVNQDQWLICKEYIPIQYLIDKKDVHVVDSDEMKKKGYGVSELIILKKKTLSGSVYCRGYHPNCCPEDGKFCLDAETSQKKIDINSLRLIKGLMSSVNLNSMYDSVSNYRVLNQFLGERNDHKEKRIT